MRPISRPLSSSTNSGVHEGEVLGQRLVDIEAAQRRALAFLGLVVNRGNFAVESLAPDAAGPLEHHQLGRVRVGHAQGPKQGSGACDAKEESR